MIAPSNQLVCAQCRSAFTVSPADDAFYATMAVPRPRLCPQCRLQRRYSMRNERVLYRRQCQLTGQSMVTIFSPDSPYTVYSQAAWWSDQWDQLQYGHEPDFTQSIFKQMKAIQLQQPRMALLAKDSENSEYTNHSAYNKDCYLGISLINCEAVLYGFMNFQSSYLVDCSYMYENSEMCYEAFYCHRNYGCAYVTLCRGCTDVWFSFDLSGCEKCFLCWNLRNKKYCWLNEQLSEAEYDRRVGEFKNMTYQQQQELIAQWQELIATKAIHQATQQVNVTASTGNYLAKSTNVTEGYYVSEAENCSYVFQAEKVKDCQDICSVAPAEACYEMTAVINNNHCKFINYSYDNSFIEYCDHVFNSQYLFACVGLNRKKYCILNKQYSAPEYDRLREKMIAYMSATGEYGEFFPMSYSPFPYNETVAHDLYPLTKAQASALGATWNDALEQSPAGVSGVVASTLPDRITEVSDEILNQTIICSVSGRPYKIQPTELYIYRKLGLPLPQVHPEVRFKKRNAQRVAPKLYRRACAHCNQEINASFAPDRSERVYCTTCYQTAVLA